MKKYLQAEWPLVLLSVTLMAFLAWHEYVVHRLSHYIDGLEAERNWTQLTNAASTLQNGDTLVMKPGLYNPMVMVFRSNWVSNMVIRSNTFHGPMKIILE